MSNATVSITIPVDHPQLDSILELVRPAPSSGTAPIAPTAGEVLSRLIDRGLNDGEIAFLLELADASPEPVPYERLVDLCGSPQKLGNVTAGLFRRWRARGGTDDNAPWQDVPNVGRLMPVEIAEIVVDRLR